MKKLFSLAFVLAMSVAALALTGDVTGDGNVDIADVNATINMMLGIEDANPAADLNGDGNVDIADVNGVINAMLGLNQNDMLLPTTDFGGNIDDIMAAEQNRGFSVTKEDNKLTLTNFMDDMTYSWIYYFDDEATFKYAHCYQTMAGFESNLIANGFAETTSSEVTKVLTNATTSQSITIVTEFDTPFYIYGKLDNSPFSWTRTDALTHDSGLWMPLLGKGAPAELMSVYELIAGHTLNTEKSNPDNGVYVYNTGDVNYPEVKYWFDAATKTKLEEAAIYVNPEQRPTVSDVEAFLNQSDFVYTALTDPSDNSRIYYNYDEKVVAFVAMDAPENEDTPFTPNIHFAFMNIDDQVPPMTVDFPTPILDFDTMTLDDAVELYKQQPYFVSVDIDEFFEMPLIQTTSEDFPYILIMDDGGKYYAAMVIATNSRIMRSPGLVSILEDDMGYTYLPDVSVLPTYVSPDRSVMAQLDINDMLGMGLYNVSFMPNEFDAMAKVTKRLQKK